MKRLFIAFLCIFLLSGCSNTVQPQQTTEIQKVDNEYVKAVWIAYYELQDFIKGNNETEFKKKINNAFSELNTMGFNTVTVQVRPCADAFYPSKLFPSSEYCFDVQEVDMPYDPLKIMCDEAKSNNLKLEAWINPYRVSQHNDISKLCDNNIAKKWYFSKKKKSNVYISDKKIFFNPASKDVQKLIIDGVKEVVNNYDVSAIHFDDYFYPTKSKTIDAAEYKKYQKEGGKSGLNDWRREKVSELIKGVYKAVKSVNPEVRFGVSPAADINNNRDKLYADVEKWVSNSGYVDYICPQVYFGFRNINQPFMFTVKKWMYITNVDLYIGLPLYKSNKADKYASSDNKTIINEFKDNDNIIERQINYISKLGNIKGFYIFSYSSLYDKNAKAEVENMLKAMQGINR